ncbi:unnamed protein product [Ceutorhynchus assimilis]|uniref:Uncharacterized protein n=1 Tax=Ceutorhynchus assimilis TaxID=467358 RepID=A0A9N9MDG9_9CUCU|nr:unnamed protein product [Ceutorhynchus assimilis]
MENLKPPANSSPEEIEAWNHMMDTMVTFIKASTNLMNTITSKVKASSRGTMQSAKSSSAAVSSCEAACSMCHPAKLEPCGICVQQVPAVQKHPGTHEKRKSAEPPCDVFPEGTESSLSPPPVPVDSVEPPPDPVIHVEETSNIPPGEPSAIEPTPEPYSPDKPEEPSVPEPTPEPGEQPEEPSVIEVAAESSAPVVEPIPKPNEDPIEKPPSILSAEKQPPEHPSIGVEPPVQPVRRPSAAAGDVQCVCASIRADRIRMQSQKADCCCRGSGKRPLQETVKSDKEKLEELPQDLEIFCACGPSQKQRDIMEQEMVEKLVKAQREITNLQEEMARLQRMNKKTGPHATPNTAQLYNEIMKGSQAQTYQGTFPTIREQGNYNLSNVRMELFQSPGWSAYDNQVRGVDSPASYQRPQYSRGRGSYPNLGRGGGSIDQRIQYARGMPMSSSGLGYQGARGSAMRQPTITSCPGSRSPAQPGGGGFQSLPGGTVFSPDLSQGPPQTGGRGFQSLPGGTVFPPDLSQKSPQTGGRGFQSLPGGTVFSQDFSQESGGRGFQSSSGGCPPTCSLAQSGGGFQSLPGGTIFSPDYSQSPFNTGFRTPEDSCPGGNRSLPAELGGPGSTSPQGRPIAAEYYQQAQTHYSPSPPQRPGGQSASAMSANSSQENSDNEAYWSRLAEYGSPAPPMQRQDKDCVCSRPKSAVNVEPQRQMIICVPPENGGK